MTGDAHRCCDSVKVTELQTSVLISHCSTLAAVTTKHPVSLLPQIHQGLKLETMRQKENLETFLESLLLSEDQFKTDAGGHTHTSLPPLSHIQRLVHIMQV